MPLDYIFPHNEEEAVQGEYNKEGTDIDRKRQKHWQ